jgi:hypothetical protein
MISLDIFGIATSLGATEGSLDFFLFAVVGPFFNTVSKASLRVRPVSISNGSTLPPEQDSSKKNSGKIDAKQINFFSLILSLNT